jgi:hypothetical protein
MKGTWKPIPANPEWLVVEARGRRIPQGARPCQFSIDAGFDEVMTIAAVLLDDDIAIPQYQCERAQSKESASACA